MLQHNNNNIAKVQLNKKIVPIRYIYYQYYVYNVTLQLNFSVLFVLKWHGINKLRNFKECWSKYCKPDISACVDNVGGRPGVKD